MSSLDRAVDILTGRINGVAMQFEDLKASLSPAGKWRLLEGLDFSAALSPYKGIMTDVSSDGAIRFSGCINTPNTDILLPKSASNR